MAEEQRIYPVILVALVLALAGQRVFLFVAIALLAVLIARPSLLAPIGRVVESVGRAVGDLISTATLAVVFFIFVLPYGIIFRLFNRALVRHVWGPPPPGASFYRDSTRTYDAASFEKQW
jgi:hypothetical protein